DEELRKEKERIQELLKRLNEIIRQQQTVRAWTERNGMDKDRLGNEQKKVTKETADLERSLGGKKGDGKEGGEKKADAKGEGKNGEALRSEEHTSELQSLTNIVCRLLLEKKKNTSTHERMCKVSRKVENNRINRHSRYIS